MGEKMLTYNQVKISKVLLQWAFILGVPAARNYFDIMNPAKNDCVELETRFPEGVASGNQDFNATGLYSPPTGAGNLDSAINSEVWTAIASAVLFGVALSYISNSNNKKSQGISIALATLISIVPALVSIGSASSVAQTGDYYGYLYAFIQACQTNATVAGCGAPDVTNTQLSDIDYSGGRCKPHVSNTAGLFIDLFILFAALGVSYGARRGFDECAFRALRSGESGAALLPYTSESTRAGADVTPLRNSTGEAAAKQDAEQTQTAAV
ncbi:MAG: hypothetical protein K0R66_1609 [Gammaproteobacteria bacterium]|jgi:hypothetical protein|nr:hypothetical protein [Gammaproteobacteria bacterium]